MKHAFLIIGMGSSETIREFIKIYDHKDVGFFIHWDKKFSQPHFTANYAKIYYLEQQSISWGGTSLSKLSLRLLETSAHFHYDFYHLMSSQDFVLVPFQEFDEFFENNIDTQFIDVVQDSERFAHRIRTFHPFESLNLPRGLKYRLAQFSGILQQSIGVDRLSKFQLKEGVGKGDQWFSVSQSFVDYVLNPERRNLVNTMLTWTFISDEMWMQTIYKNSPLYTKDYQRIRYIDWKRGNPYVFRSSDYQFLQCKRQNSQSLFIRKVTNGLAKRLAEGYQNE